MNIHKLLLLFFLLNLAFNALSQIDTSDVNSTPYGVIYNHLYYLQQDSYDVNRSTFSFPENIENAEQISIQLKQIIDGKGYYIDINQLPQDSNYQDSLSKKKIYLIHHNEPRIYVEKIDGNWFYSRTTLEQIPILYEEVFPFGTGLKKYFSGPTWEYKIFNVSAFKWLGLLVLFLLSVIIFYIANFLSKWLVTRLLKNRFQISDLTKRDIKKMGRIFGLFLATRIFLSITPMLQLPIRMNSMLIKTLGILSIFFLILLITRISRIIFHYLDSLARKTENTLDDQLLPVISRIVIFIIWAIGVIYVMEFLDVNVTALLAGISIGGLALALAAQDTVKNFFGSIMIFVDRPFQIGDWIHFDDIDGTVEEVGVRSTRIRTFANSVVYVPNGMLANKVVNNMGLRQFRRFKTELGVTYNTPPHKIDLFVKGIRDIILKHPTTRKDFFEVHLNSFGDSSINVLLYCFFEARDWNAELKGKHDIVYAILLLAEGLGVSFAFPSQSIYVESMPSSKNGDRDSSENPLEKSLQKVDEYFLSKMDQQSPDKIKPLGGA
ncbi:MAG: mechanosensitive ion channel family protein [Bacteroidia bacterium]|nr:mechanosensitive ion channel family protein [Bacteroidia bacterium]